MCSFFANGNQIKFDIVVYIYIYMNVFFVSTDPGKVIVASVPHSNSFLQKELSRVSDGPSPVVLRGHFTNSVGSPHIGSIHPPLPPSCIIEELHRALASKLRQER